MDVCSKYQSLVFVMYDSIPTLNYSFSIKKGVSYAQWDRGYKISLSGTDIHSLINSHRVNNYDLLHVVIHFTKDNPYLPQFHTTNDFPLEEGSPPWLDSIIHPLPACCCGAVGAVGM